LHLAPSAPGVSFGRIRVFTALQPFQQAASCRTAKGLAAGVSSWEQGRRGALGSGGKRRTGASTNTLGEALAWRLVWLKVPGLEMRPILGQLCAHQLM